MRSSMPYLVGTSGWSYDDWVGVFYPEGLRDRKDRWLRHYGRYFSTVEINSTFYAVPPERTVAAWVEKGKRMKGFEFSLKLPQDLTHRAMVDGWTPGAKQLLDTFCDRVLDPLTQESLLGCTLLQLSPYFHNEGGALEVLGSVLGTMQDRGFATSVEPRHATWLDADQKAVAPDAAAVLEEHDSALCVTDGPGFPVISAGKCSHAYVRFHGRNRDIWFKGGKDRGTEDGDGAPDERMNRYDYRYDKGELGEWVPRLEAMEEEEASRVRVYFNNHPKGSAVQNAVQVMEMLGVPHTPVSIRTPDQRRLFDY